MGVSEKVKRCADIIYGWFLTYQISGQNATNQNADGDNISCHVQSLPLLNLDSKSFVWTLGRVLTSWMICTKWLEVVRKSRDTGVNVSWVVEFPTFNWTIIGFSPIWLILKSLHLSHTAHSWNIMCQKWEGDCGLWVPNEIIWKLIYWKFEKNRGSHLGVAC